jgi:acyl carrier protein
METSETETKIRAIIGRIASLPAGFSGSEDLFRGLGLKSASALDLLLSLEEEFGVSLSDEAFGEARTVDALVTLVRSVK